MNLPEICRKVRDQMCEEYDCTPYQINCGLCDEFMMRVRKYVGDRLNIKAWEATVYEIGPIPGHYWVYDPRTSRHYDAEAINGVDHASKLPIFWRYRTVKSKS